MLLLLLLLHAYNCRLPYLVQVVRDQQGAHMPDVSSMPLSFRCNVVQRRAGVKREMKAFMLGTHRRLGRHSAVIRLAGTDLVLSLIRDFLLPPRRRKVVRSKRLSACAKDHIHTVQRLTPEQWQQRYPLACAERWGTRGSYDEHTWDGDEDGAPLRELFDLSPPCASCGDDGEQFFSFCLNRSVNSNIVHHCEFCGRCFYFCAGNKRGCQHCGRGYFYRDEFSDEEDMEATALACCAGVPKATALTWLKKYPYPKAVPILYEPHSRGCCWPKYEPPPTEGYWDYYSL
jgi:hypothetical protein